MLITPINSKIQPYTQKLCQSTQSRKAGNSYNTNPLACDTFTPSVSFKAQIHDYAKNGDLEGLKRELANGVDVNSKDIFKKAALIWASLKGHIEIVKELLKYPNIDVNTQDESKNTALIWASYKGHIEIVKELLKYPNIDVNTQDESKNTALIWASLNGHIEIVKELLKHPDIDVNRQDNDKNTALMWASNNDNIEIVKELLKHPNIDVNSQNYNKNTALIWASNNDNIEIVKELLKHPNIDVNSKDEDKNTALILASYHDNIEIVKELLKHPNIDVNIKDAYGKTALDYANNEIKKMIEEYVPGVDKREDVMVAVNIKKPQVDINKLSPEENIWTKEEISNQFLNMVTAKRYDDAQKMLESTPLIDLEGNNNKILNEVCGTKDSRFAKKVFDYLFHKQAQMQTEYDTRRKEFLENTIKALAYETLHFNNIALNTIDGFKILMDNPEFNPNDTVENSSLFERACIIDPEGNLAKEILSKYGDVKTENAAKTSNKVIKDLIENYEKEGKYKFVLNSIEDNAFYESKRNIAANQLKGLLESPTFTPEIADEVGNSVLHIAAALPDDMGRTLIQMALDKGVDINAGNCTGQRPLMSAIKKLVTTDDKAGKMNLMSNIKFLLDKGADVNAQDNNGQTAFHFACMSTVGALLTLLLSKNPNVFLPDKYGNRACVYLKTPEMKEIYNEYINRGNNIIK